MPLLNQHRPHIDIAPPDPHYPAFRFHQDGRTLLVKAKHLEPTEEGWGFKPVPQPEKVEVTPEARILQLERELAVAKNEAENQRKKFDAAWEELTQEHETLRSAHEALVAELEATTEGRDAVLQADAESTAAAPKTKKGK